MRWMVAAAAIAILWVPVAPADAITDGFSGALTGFGDLQTHGSLEFDSMTGSFVPSQDLAREAVPVARGDTLRMQVLEFAEGSDWNDAVLHAPEYLRQADVTLTAVRADSQVFVNSYSPSYASTTVVNATLNAVTCQFSAPRDSVSPPFPRAPTPKANPFFPASNTANGTAITCSPGGLAMPGTWDVYLYDLDLEIHSLAGTRSVRTGRSVSIDPLTGQPHTTVTFVYLQNSDLLYGHGSFALTRFEVASLYQTRVMSLDRLEFHDARGWLEWGVHGIHGPIDAFEVAGKIEISTDGKGGVELTGKLAALPLRVPSRVDPEVAAVLPALPVYPVGLASGFRTGATTHAEGSFMLPFTEEEGVLTAELADGGPASGAHLLESAKARWTLKKWVHPPGGGQAIPTTPETSITPVTDLRLDASAFSDAPQVMATENWPDAPAATPQGATLEGANCDVRMRTDTDVEYFPTAGSSSGRGLWTEFAPAMGALVSDCSANVLDLTSRTASYAIYGMVVDVAGSGEAAHRFATGTFEQKDRTTGIPQKVTQILEIYPEWDVGSDTKLTLEGALHVRTIGPTAIAIGHLQVPSSTGWLNWGSLKRDGELDPWAADGAFRMGGRPDGSIRLDGTTISVPATAEAAALVPKAYGWNPARVGALAAGLLSLGFLAVLVRGAVPLFTRLLPDRVLSHPRRARILAFVAAQPGVGTNVVAKALGMPWGKALHHVRVLERTGRIKVRRIDGRTALFLPSRETQGNEEKIHLLGRDTLGRLHAILLERPGRAQAELAELLRLRQPRVSKALDRLVRAELVRVEVQAGRKFYHAIDASTPVSGQGPRIV